MSVPPVGKPEPALLLLAQIVQTACERTESLCGEKTTSRLRMHQPGGPKDEVTIAFNPDRSRVTGGGDLLVRGNLGGKYLSMRGKVGAETGLSLASDDLSEVSAKLAAAPDEAGGWRVAGNLAGFHADFTRAWQRNSEGQEYVGTFMGSPFLITRTVVSGPEAGDRWRGPEEPTVELSAQYKGKLTKVTIQNEWKDPVGNNLFGNNLLDASGSLGNVSFISPKEEVAFSC